MFNEASPNISLTKEMFTISIGEDNIAFTNIERNSVVIAMSKHIDIKHQLLFDQIWKGKIGLHYDKSL